MSNRLKVFIGYDTREDIAWQVCRHSILRHVSKDIEIYPLKQSLLRETGLYTRPADQASTEFSLTRFLTPYLAAHDGWTIFVDCDFIFTCDIYNVLAEVNDNKAVYVVQHDYIPANKIKMDNQVQTQYPRKNWSSFMLFNGSHPEVKALTPEIVNTAQPSFLHRFGWLQDESIGELPLAWNFLVGEYPLSSKLPHAIHYTNGGPWFEQWRDVNYANLWCDEQDRFLESIADNKLRHQVLG